MFETNFYGTVIEHDEDVVQERFTPTSKPFKTFTSEGRVKGLNLIWSKRLRSYHQNRPPSVRDRRRGDISQLSSSCYPAMSSIFQVTMAGGLAPVKRIRTHRDDGSMQ